MGKRKKKVADLPTRLKDIRGAKIKSVVSSIKDMRLVHQCWPNHSSITPLWWMLLADVPENTSPAKTSHFYFNLYSRSISIVLNSLKICIYIQAGHSQQKSKKGDWTQLKILYSFLSNWLLNFWVWPLAIELQTPNLRGNKLGNIILALKIS